MTSERDKCGLTSLLPMSCRGRAEAFARRLQSRLSSLGSEDGNGSADESSWLAAHENPIAISQPKHTSESDLYLDFNLLESPGSPEEEIEESELHRLINKDHLQLLHNEDCHCPRSTCNLNVSVPKSTSNDSDSDGPFYDTENDVETLRVNGISTSESSSSFNKSQDSDTENNSPQEGSSYQTEESYATTSEGTLPIQPSLSDEASTLSIKDEDYPSLESNGPIEETEYSTNNGEIETEETCSNDPKLNGSVEETEYSTEIKIETTCNGDYSNHNGYTNGLDETKETYVSSLNVEKDLTVECPGNGIEKTSIEIVKVNNHNIEIQVNDDDDDDIDERIPRVRRCSSLKTGKTPPGTPGRKKIVRFADVLGLDLADVRTFLDEIPKIPISAYEDLTDVDLSESSSENNLITHHGPKPDKVLVPLFQQPGGQANFLDLVRENFVCLENALVGDPVAFSITGTVRVRNLDFHKSVHIRYTLDSWKTFADVQGVYLDNSCDGFSDKFSFIIYAHTLSVGQRLEFAVRFQCRGCQYWDSNKGANYCFQCLPVTNSTPYTPITGTDVDHWGASFY